MLLLNDLESSKEVELHYLAEGFLRRGLGTLTLDAPGQGELSGAGSILDFDAALPRMVDFLSERTHSCVGVFGIGLGGYLACRAAALEPRIAAAACVSGFYDGRGVARFSSRARKALRRCCDAPEDVPWEDLAGMLSLEPLWGRLDRPLLIVHRRNDPVVDLRQVEALRAWASGNTQVWIVDQADNACTPRLTECLPVIGDWMCNHLRTSQAATAMMEIKSIVA